MRTVLWGAFAVAALTAAPVHAQSDHPAHFIIGGGMSTPEAAWRIDSTRAAPSPSA